MNNTKERIKKAYQLKEVAEMFDIPLGTLRNWKSKNKFKSYKRGKHVFVNINEFENFLIGNG